MNRPSSNATSSNDSSRHISTDHGSMVDCKLNDVKLDLKHDVSCNINGNCLRTGKLGVFVLLGMG